MSIIISLFIIGISLSMDTFSLSLSLGTFNISRRKVLLFVSIVGIMHFLFPLIGVFLGARVITFLNVNANILLAIILLLIAIEMIFNINKDDNNNFSFNIINILLLAVSVSLDSFSTGLGLSAITNNYILSGIIFSLCAMSFTVMGFLIGIYSGEKLGIYAKVIGISLLIVLSIYHFFI